jgi:DNA-binding transcriptional ArsR family regulator
MKECPMLLKTQTQEISQLEANLCYAFVDPTRIRILYALNAGPHNVTELTIQIGSNQPKISRHLKVLRDLGLVRTTRQGVTITYELSDVRLIEALDILRGVLRDSLAVRADMIAKID